MNEISLSTILRMLLHRLWAIILATVLCATLAFSYCKFLVTPVYQTKASIIVTNGAIITSTDFDSTISNTDLAASLYLIETTIDILKSPKIYQELSNAMNNKYSYKSLSNSFSISRRSDDSLFVDIAFKSTSSKEAIEIVNTFTELSDDYICEVIPTATVVPMSYADSAVVVSPRIIFTTIIFGFIGAIIASVLVVIISTLDKAIKGEEDFKTNFDIPVLGAVPDFDNSNSSSYSKKKTSGGY